MIKGSAVPCAGTCDCKTIPTNDITLLIPEPLFNILSSTSADFQSRSFPADSNFQVYSSTFESECTTNPYATISDVHILCTGDIPDSVASAFLQPSFERTDSVPIQLCTSEISSSLNDNLSSVHYPTDPSNSLSSSVLLNESMPAPDSDLNSEFAQTIDCTLIEDEALCNLIIAQDIGNKKFDYPESSDLNINTRKFRLRMNRDRAPRVRLGRPKMVLESTETSEAHISEVSENEAEAKVGDDDQSDQYDADTEFDNTECDTENDGEPRILDKTQEGSTDSTNSTETTSDSAESNQEVFTNDASEQSESEPTTEATELMTADSSSFSENLSKSNYLHPVYDDWNEYQFEEGDYVIVPTETHNSALDEANYGFAFTLYKTVDKKVKPISGIFPQEARVERKMPHNPLDSLPVLPVKPPDFTPTERLTEERIEALEVNKDNFLWPEEEKLFKHIMMLNERTLPYEERDRGSLSREYFSDYIMPTIPHIPWEFKNIPIPPGIRDQVVALLKSKIEAGVYEPSQSSYRCRWFCVLKKNGSLRIIHDLQPLNAISIRDAGLLPIVDDFVEPFGGNQCCTIFDLFWGFDARIVDPRSRDMTAFYTPLGLLRLTSLPMGYTNSPAEFQNCMTFILRDEIPHVANIFIDDLPIKGPATQYLQDNGTPETIKENPGIRRFIWEHANDVHRVMHRIGCAGATFSPKKTQICRPEVIIIGQRCHPEGRSPDPDRIEKIIRWPVARNITEIRGFLGLCGTVRIWIESFSKITRPLVELTKKTVMFEWNDERQEAFDILKEKVTTAPALRALDYRSSNPIILSVDSSYIAVGMILAQNDDDDRRRPSRYGSIPMSAVQAGYSQPKLELFGLFRAFKHWKLILYGIRNLVVEVDAQSIKGMINGPDVAPNNTMNRWLQGILLFDFTLKHVPGADFKGPDGLSRRRPASSEEFSEGDDSWLDDIALLLIVPDPYTYEDFHFEGPMVLPYHSQQLPSSHTKNIRAEQTLINIKHFLDTLELPKEPFKNIQARRRFIQQTGNYYLSNNKLMRRNGRRLPLQVIFDRKKRVAILTQAHEQMGHKGEMAVGDLVKARFYWPHMRTDIHHHVASCHDCQIRSLKRMKVSPTVSTPATIFTKIYVDVMVMPKAGGFGFIVAAKDDLTGITEVAALRKNNALALSKFFREKILFRYGMVGQVITDNGSEMRGAFNILMKRYGVNRIKVSRYNKQANGVVERGHYTLREAIVKATPRNAAGNIGPWHEYVDAAMFADRVTISSVTGYSPYRLLHGVDPVLPFDLTEATLLVEGFYSGMSTEELLVLRIRQLNKLDEDIAQAARALIKARFRSKQQFNRRYIHRLQKEEYKPGELVLVQNSSREMHVNRWKTHPRYVGPYEVIEKTQGGAYRLKELDGTEHKHSYAAFRLLGYISRSDPLLQELSDNLPEDDTEIQNLADSDIPLDLLEDNPFQKLGDSDQGSTEEGSP